MKSGDVAAWIAAVFAMATFAMWVFDKVRAHRQRPRATLSVKLWATARGHKQGRPFEAEVVRISNTGDAPAIVEFGMFFRGAELVQEEGFELPNVIPAGGECRLLVTDVERDRAHVVITTRDQRLRWLFIQWFPLDSASPLRDEVDRQFAEEQGLSRSALRRHVQSAPVGPGGVVGVLIKTKHPGALQAIDAALGQGPLQPYKNWLQRSWLAQKLGDRTWLRRASSEAAAPGPTSE